MWVQNVVNIRSTLKFTPPPLQKHDRQFSFVELISLGLPAKSVTWLLEIISGELIAVGLPESLAGSQRSVR